MAHAHFHDTRGHHDDTLAPPLVIARRNARLAGLGGVAGIDVWDATGSIVQDLTHPIILSMAKQVIPLPIYSISSFRSSNQKCRVSGNGILETNPKRTRR